MSALLKLTLLAYNTRFVASQIAKLGLNKSIKKYGPELVKKAQAYIKKKNKVKVEKMKPSSKVKQEKVENLPVFEKLGKKYVNKGYDYSYLNKGSDISKGMFKKKTP